MTVTSKPTYTELRDAQAFPSFWSCPDEYNAPDTYYHIRDEGVYAPARHWCFLGEITDITFLGRLRLWAQDKARERVHIAFHLDHRDRNGSLVGRTFELNDPRDLPNHPNVPRHLIEKGNTIAILYGQRHLFFDSTRGFRIEAADGLQIFPCNLEKLLNLSDEIMPADDVLENERSCARCAVTSTSLQRCSACCITWYCGKECQIADWSNGGHKKNCKLAKQVALLMKQDWEHFTSHYSFPLPKKRFLYLV